MPDVIPIVHYAMTKKDYEEFVEKHKRPHSWEPQHKHAKASESGPNKIN